MVKPGIRQLALTRSKELNKSKRSRLNCLLMKQSYFTKELQSDNTNTTMFRRLKEIKAEICEWFESESRKVILQSRVDDVQQSEKVRIYHHEQHKKEMKRLAILKLDTGSRIIVGHEEVSAFLESQVADLLQHPAVLDPVAQATLLNEVTKVFTDKDNENLLKPPDKEEVKSVLFNSNLNAAPGSDGITSLLYKEHWDVLGDYLVEMVAAVHGGGKPTKSQRTSLMVFGTKPKKLSSIKARDKRRISLLNSDFKLMTGIEAARFRKTFTYTLSSSQMMAGDDRRIHHMINKARDCIFSVSKSKFGCALLDLDFVAAFDYQVFSWVFDVLRAKGVAEAVISRISNIYQDSVTIPVINNVLGQPLKNRRENLRQGCPGSMGWFGVAIDPLLVYLEKRLTGIPICSLPTIGPCLENGAPPQPVSERYIVRGYADDVKPSVANMSEFELVDKAASLFERSSGCVLHRDPTLGKFKVLPLGRWRQTLQQEDIRFPYLQLCSSLSMVGVELTASWQSTRKLNNDEIQERVQSRLASWKSGTFLPLICRPFSINTYCLSKVWFRTSCVDLRVLDITAITSKVKSYCYQDLFQKPSEILLYRRVHEGGLGLYHLKCKAQAHLISTFLQTASGMKFQQSLFHFWLYQYHVEGRHELPDPGYTPYYDKEFFKQIKDVKDKSPLNPLYMSVKEWYRLLLEKYVTMREVDDEGRRELIPCKIEERDPHRGWMDSYRTARLPGLSPDNKSFMFRLLHTLLPSRERLHHLTPAASPLCWCRERVPETYKHLFFTCQHNRDAAQSLLRCIQSYQEDLTEEKVLRLELTADDPFRLPSAALLAVGLEYIWERRKQKKSTRPYEMRTELELAVTIRRKASSRRILESAEIMHNMLINFFD